MKWRTVLATSFALFLSYLTPALSQDSNVKKCNDLGVVGFFSKLLDIRSTPFTESSVNAFCNEFDKLVQSVEGLKKELDVVRSKLPPPDSILIVDDESGCPDGWTNVALKEPHVFKGRVPVIAAPPGEKGRFTYRITGGATKRSLELNHLPSHAHGTVIHAGQHDKVGWEKLPVDSDDVGETFVIKIARRLPSPTLVFATRKAGEGDSFRIMPPYVPLHLCKLG